MWDTHTHLNFKAFQDDWETVVARAIAAGVEKMIVVGTDVATSSKAVVMAQQHDALYAAVGIHPHHAKSFLASNKEMRAELDAIKALVLDPKVVAVGEIGLDKHEYKSLQYGQRDSALDEQDFALQIDLFKAQLQMAKACNKPVIIHSRDLRDDVLTHITQTFSQEQMIRGVFHCFEGSKKYLKRIIEAGFLVSFTGNTTFNPERAEVSTGVPLDRLLLETDCPYMTPELYRGKRNEPQYVAEIAKQHAHSRGIQVDEVVAQTTQNARALFEAVEMR